jgi:hypothetical protein
MSMEIYVYANARYEQIWNALEMQKVSNLWKCKRYQSYEMLKEMLKVSNPKEMCLEYIVFGADEWLSI